MSSVSVSEVEFLGFALGDCTVDLGTAAAKYLRVVHGTALELAVHNQFGAEFGGSGCCHLKSLNYAVSPNTILPKKHHS